MLVQKSELKKKAKNFKHVLYRYINESYTPPPADLAPIPHLSLCVNFQSFFSFWTACGAPSIEVDTTEQQVARHNQPNIYIRTTNRQQHTEIQYLWKHFCSTKYTPKTAANPELHLASHGLVVAPRLSHTAVLPWYILPGNILHPFLVDTIIIHSNQVFYSRQTIPDTSTHNHSQLNIFFIAHNVYYWS